MPSSTLPRLPIHHASRPYTDDPTRLRTVDIWLPRPLEDSDPKKHVWIVYDRSWLLDLIHHTLTVSTIILIRRSYIHGGAWRDPAQTSETLLPTLKHLSPQALSRIASIASINYRLSPYAKHPENPSKPDDEERNVQHPTHVKDVAAALNYLGAEYGLGKRKGGESEAFQWLAAGHSCGATLLCQYVSRIGLQDDDVTVRGPRGLMLLEGIYDIPAFVTNHQPPKCPEEIAHIYEDIVVGAFTEKEEAWRAASPVAGKFTKEKWKDGRVVYVCYSSEDELVEEEQSVKMKKKFEDDGWTEQNDSNEDRILEWRALNGKHDWIWEDGTQIAKCMEDMLAGVAKYL